MARSFVAINTQYIAGGAIALPSAGSISIWVCNNGSQQQITPWQFGDGSGQDYPGLQRYVSDKTIYAGFNHDGNSRITVNDTSHTYFADNIWASWIFNWSAAGGQNLYKDAAAVGTPTAYTHTAHSYGFNLGRWTVGGGDSTCSLSDFTFWNVVLTAGEMAAIAKGVRPSRIRPGAVKIWLPLTGLASPEPDLSGNGINGTLNGTGNPAYAADPPLNMFTPRWPRNYDPVTTVPLSQTHFRFRTDTNAVDATPTWGDAEDAA